MSPPLVSIVILNWNGSKCIRECLESVIKTAYSSIEIIVVDNASTDDSKSIIRNFPTALLLELPQNIGFAAGNNAGFAKATGTYIATLNNDVVVDPQWLNQPVALFEKIRSIGIVACRQMNFYNRETIDCLYTYPLRSLLLEPMGSTKRYVQKELYTQPGFVFGAGGASALYRKAVITALGGFDERYFAYHEESDLCMRAFLSGWKCAYAPEAIVYHRGSFSFNTIQKKMVFLHERNRVWFIYKFYPLSYIGKNIFWILLWQLRVARVWIIKRNAGWIFFKALYAGFKGRACFREERKKNSIAFNEKCREFDIFVRQKKIPLQ